MPTATELQNPYLDEVRERLDIDILAGGMDRYVDSVRLRWPAIDKYSFAVPTATAIYDIAQRGPVVEMGAGLGYWAWMIKQAGGDVIAYDDFSWFVDGSEAENVRNKFHRDKTWFPINHGTPATLEAHPDRNLLLCWPPYDDSMALDCLVHWQGEFLFYIGEGPGGCTGDEMFHERADELFTTVKEIHLPQWPGLHDRLYIMRRRRRRRAAPAPFQESSNARG